MTTLPRSAVLINRFGAGLNLVGTLFGLLHAILLPEQMAIAYVGLAFVYFNLFLGFIRHMPGLLVLLLLGFGTLEGLCFLFAGEAILGIIVILTVSLNCWEWMTNGSWAIH